MDLPDKLRGYFARIRKVAADAERTTENKLEEIDRDAELAMGLIDREKGGKRK